MKKRPETNAVHAGVRRSAYGEVSEAIYLTQSFAYDTAEQALARFSECGEDEFIYARFGNPTVRMFEERIAVQEGAEDAFATASGMAAVSGILTAMLKAGDRVVSSRSLFGSCLYILETVLPRFGVEVVFVDGTDLGEWRSALTPDTSMVFFETLSNPTLEAVDIAAVSEIARSAGAVVVVDNVFSTPIFQRTFELGADAVIYSATKHIDGQGRCLGGVILGSRDLIRGAVEPYLKHSGGAISPFNAWVMLKGMETLHLRCNAQADSALALARVMEGRRSVARVIYPGLPSHPQHDLAMGQMIKGGTVVAVELRGGREAAFRFLNALEVITISNNLGDAKSLATHPATTTHQRLSEDARARLGITEGLVRISLGLEHVDDLIEDVIGALP